jgi:hypothetical protein
MSAKVVSIVGSPGDATATANSAQNQIVYKAEVEYADNHRDPDRRRAVASTSVLGEFPILRTRSQAVRILRQQGNG